MIEENVCLSDDESIGIHQNGDIYYEGTLSKWTNYIHGWQERFIVLKDGTLSYFKSSTETQFGCRGALSTNRCQIKLNELDECRFDVSFGDSTWCFRADSQDERDRWYHAIEASRQNDSAYGSDNSLKRHGSAVSLVSLKKHHEFKEQQEELELYRDTLFKKLDFILDHFDACGKVCLASDDGKLSNVNGSNESVTTCLVDFKDEAEKFKVTCDGLISNLTHCIDTIQHQEETWRRKVDIEIDRRKHLEEIIKKENVVDRKKDDRYNDPDYEEGPHSRIKEEEFFDAVDAMLDKKDLQEEEKRLVKIRAKEIGEPSSVLPVVCDHPLWSEIERITTDQLYYARLDVGDVESENGWQIFAEEGEMKLYKRDLEIDGLVCDPLKAVHTVRGITAHEVCYHFFSPDVRWDWENTLEITKVIEEINPNSLIFHQVHKRIWPAAQRDAVFWSHIRRIDPNSLSKKDDKIFDIWTVCNNSIERQDIPLGRCVRMKLTVSMTCETYIDDVPEGQEITRDNIKCKIIYCSTINPGGWAPASVLRSLYKREYPKFLKNYTQYVIDAQEKKPIMF